MCGCVQAHQERAYCAAHFLSQGTLSMIEGMRQQLLGELTGRRLVRSLGDASAAARDAGLVRCVLVRGLSHILVNDIFVNDSF